MCSQLGCNKDGRDLNCELVLNSIRQNWIFDCTGRQVRSIIFSAFIGLRLLHFLDIIITYHQKRLKSLTQLLIQNYLYQQQQSTHAYFVIFLIWYFAWLFLTFNDDLCFQVNKKPIMIILKLRRRSIFCLVMLSVVQDINLPQSWAQTSIAPWYNNILPVVYVNSLIPKSLFTYNNKINVKNRSLFEFEVAIRSLRPLISKQLDGWPIAW